jgi:hypothetical protein
MELVKLNRVLSSGSTLPVYLNPTQVLFVQGGWKPGQSAVFMTGDQTLTVAGDHAAVAQQLSGANVREPASAR